MRRASTYRAMNRLLNWYERRTGRVFGPGHLGYSLYYRIWIQGH